MILSRPIVSPWLPFGSPVIDADTCLIAFHHAGGAASSFRHWLDHPLLKGIAICPMELPGRGRRFLEPPQPDLGALLSDMHPLLREIAGCYRNVLLFGHSLGSLFAYESALHLQDSGFRPRALIVSARRAPQLPTPTPWRHLMDARALTVELRRLGGTQEEVLAHDELLELVLPAIRSDFALTEIYRPATVRKAECPVLALHGKDDAEVSAGDVAAWEAVAGSGFACRAYQGGHFFLNDAAVFADMIGDIRAHANLS